MPNTRRRRIVRHTAMALAVVVLLPVWYVSSLMALCFLLGANILPTGLGNSRVLVCYAVPANWYHESGWPGSTEFGALMQWSGQAGERWR